MKYLLLLALPTLAVAQPLPPPPGIVQPPRDALSLLDYEGSEIFRFLLHRQGLKPVTRVAEVLAEPANSIIIVHGDTFALRNDYGLGGRQLRAFINNGGAVLIAGDSAADDQPNSWSVQFGIARQGQRLKAAKADSYRETETRPFVRPVLDQAKLAMHVKTEPFHLFANLEAKGPKALATDLPSAMYLIAPVAREFIRTRLAEYPLSSETAARGGAPFDPKGCSFAVAYTPDPRFLNGPGRMLILADHSVFVNGMTGFQRDPNDANGLITDNYNSVFIKQMTEWLQAGGPEKRTQCLFIEDGSIVEKFAEQIKTTKPNQQPPLPPITPDIVATVGNHVLDAMNKAVDQAEERDTFNRALVRFFGRKRLVQFFLIVLAVWAMVFALRRYGRSMWQVNPSAAPPPSTLESLLPHGGITQQRVDAQIDVNNFYEAARSRVRDRYDRMGGQPTTNGKIPPVLIANGGLDAERLLETICGLWLIGYGEKPVHVGPGEWDNMNRDLESTLKRARRGEWSFGQEL